MLIEPMILRHINPFTRLLIDQEAVEWSRIVARNLNLRQNGERNPIRDAAEVLNFIIRARLLFEMVLCLIP